MIKECDITHFDRVCREALINARTAGGIGTYKERQLHAVLKRYFEEDESCHEVRVLGYVADIKNGSEIIEIQTGAFYRMREKLKCYLENGFDVTIIYPVSQKKWILWIDEESGSISNRRRSPRIGRIFDIIPELYAIKSMLTNSRLQICVMMLEVEDFRLLCGYSADKKKGSSRYERIPTALFGQHMLNAPQDYLVFLPECLPERFFARDYAKAAKIRMANAYKALAILNELGIVKKGEKQGRAFLYERVCN